MFSTTIILALLSLGASLPLPSKAGPFEISGFSTLPTQRPISKPEINTGVIPTAWRHIHGTLKVPGESSSAPTATTAAAATNTNTNTLATSIISTTSASITTTTSVAATTNTASVFAAIGDMVVQARHNSCRNFCEVNPWICQYCIPGEETHLKEGAHKRAEKTAGGKDRRDDDDDDDDDDDEWEYEMGDCIPGFSWGC